MLEAEVLTGETGVVLDEFEGPSVDEEIEALEVDETGGNVGPLEVWFALLVDWLDTAVPLEETAVGEPAGELIVPLPNGYGALQYSPSHPRYAADVELSHVAKMQLVTSVLLHNEASDVTFSMPIQTPQQEGRVKPVDVGEAAPVPVGRPVKGGEIPVDPATLDEVLLTEYGAVGPTEGLAVDEDKLELVLPSRLLLFELTDGVTDALVDVNGDVTGALDEEFVVVALTTTGDDVDAGTVLVELAVELGASVEFVVLQ